MVPTTSQSKQIHVQLLAGGIFNLELQLIPTQRTLITIGSGLDQIPHRYTATHLHTTNINIDIKSLNYSNHNI